MEDFPKLAPLPVEPEEDEVADDLKVQRQKNIYECCESKLLQITDMLIPAHRSRLQLEGSRVGLVLLIHTQRKTGMAIMCPVHCEEF